MKSADFFGLNLNQYAFRVDYHLKQVGLYDRVLKEESIQELIEKYSSDHQIVSIAKRQLALKLLTPLINARLLPYDSIFYNKRVNTATENDRRYDAEEQLLNYCLVMATGKTLKALDEIGFVPNIRSLREGMDRKRFDRVWAILAEHTIDYIHNVKKLEKGRKGEKKGFFKNLFS